MCLDYACHSQILSNQPVLGNDQNKPYGLLLDPTSIRAATIQLPHDTIRITIFASRYDTYRNTFLTTLEP